MGKLNHTLVVARYLRRTRRRFVFPGADLGPKVFGIGRNRGERLGGHLEEQPIDERLVAVRQRTDRIRMSSSMR